MTDLIAETEGTIKNSRRIWLDIYDMENWIDKKKLNLLFDVEKIYELHLRKNGSNLNFGRASLLSMRVYKLFRRTFLCELINFMILIDFIRLYYCLIIRQNVKDC